MKTILLTIFFACALVGAHAQTTSTTIKVYGNCFMCKKRIETALDKNGIKQASWDSKTKLLTVVYNEKRITEEQIHQTVASVGHDTEKVTAEDSVYITLPFCCLYRDHEMPEDHKH